MSWYNKYRPKDLEHLIGQDYAKKLLEKEVKKPHRAYLFVGESGVGKTSSARIFGNLLDGEIIEIDGATHSGVDNIRELSSLAYYVPPFHTHRVFIIDECHMLSTSAWNALLKVLEESPETTIWILATTNHQKVPDTIVSRSVHVPFSNVDLKLLVQHLKDIASQEQADVPENIIHQIALSSSGRIREAIVNLETYCLTGMIKLPLSHIDIIDFLIALFDGKMDKVDSFIKEKIKNKEDVLDIVKFLADYQKMLVMRVATPLSVPTEDLLLTYTKIAPVLIDALRGLQTAISQHVKVMYADTIILISELMHSIMEYHTATSDLITFEFAIYTFGGKLLGQTSN